MFDLSHDEKGFSQKWLVFFMPQAYSWNNLGQCEDFNQVWPFEQSCFLIVLQAWKTITSQGVMISSKCKKLVTSYLKTQTKNNQQIEMQQEEENSEIWKNVKKKTLDFGMWCILMANTIFQCYQGLCITL